MIVKSYSHNMRILFVANGDDGWLGGVYYVNNIIHQLLAYKNENIKIYIYTNDRIANIFKSMPKKNVRLIITKKEDDYGAWHELDKKIFGCAENRKIIYWVLKYRIDYVFPYFSEGYMYEKLLAKKCITWIADFQHIHYPQYFTSEEKKERDLLFEKKALRHYKLVLSSKDAYDDYRNLYPNSLSGVYIIHFASYMDKGIVFNNKIESVKKKYSIVGNYFMICNQFWMHKNYLLAFEAIRKSRNKDILLVCTGKLEDYRNKGFIREIKRYLKENNLEKNVRLLGVIEKEDQIQLMKGAIAIVQPSLFEGWGTSVEEAKTLDKITVMSDIAVHYEQANNKSILFEKNNSEELAKILDELWEEYAEKEVEWGYQLADAKKYGRLFYKMLVDKR